MKSRKLKSKWHEGILLLLAAMTFAAAPPAAQSQAVKGTGTTNKVPLWTSSSTLGSSALSQSGSDLNASGGVTAASFSTSGGIRAASFTGNGSGITNVNAAQLGGIPSSGFAQLGAASNSFTGTLSAASYQIGGTQVLSISPGNFNLFVGQSAGAGAGNSNTGTQNTAVGDQALFSNTSGNFNSAIGAFALFTNTTGGGNTATGYNALASESTGSFNTAIGSAALTRNTTGGENTAVGASALQSSTGSGNVGIGTNTLFFNSADGNTAIGTNSLFRITAGSANIAIGGAAGSNFTASESNNIDIGNFGTAGESGAIRIGDASTQTAAYIAGINSAIVSGSTVFVDSNGQLGIAPSSRRYKEDINDMGAVSDGLLRLRPVTFRYKKPYADGSKPIQYGLIAEEVAEVYPDLVVRGKDGQVETVQYYKLDAILLNEVQKLTKLHASDEVEIAQLQSQIAEQRKQGQEQQAAIRHLLSQVHSIQITVEASRSARPHRRVARTAARKATGPEVAATIAQSGALRR